MSSRAEAAKSVELFVASQEAPDTYTHEPIGYAPIPTHPRDAAHPRPFISLAFGLSESAPLIPHYSKHQLDRAVIEGPGRPELTSLPPQQPKAFEQAPVATESGVTGKYGYETREWSDVMPGQTDADSDPVPAVPSNSSFGSQ